VAFTVAFLLVVSPAARCARCCARSSSAAPAWWERWRSRWWSGWSRASRWCSWSRGARAPGRLGAGAVPDRDVGGVVGWGVTSPGCGSPSAASSSRPSWCTSRRRPRGSRGRSSHPESTQRVGLERGVAESINALVHYAVITLGVLLALGALGSGAAELRDRGGRAGGGDRLRAAERGEQLRQRADPPLRAAGPGRRHGGDRGGVGDHQEDRAPLDGGGHLLPVGADRPQRRPGLARR
jgi:hypothetical protein